MNSYDKDRTVTRRSYFYNGNSYTGKTAIAYWDGLQGFMLWVRSNLNHPTNSGPAIFIYIRLAVSKDIIVAIANVLMFNLQLFLLTTGAGQLGKRDSLRRKQVIFCTELYIEC